MADDAVRAQLAEMRAARAQAALEAVERNDKTVYANRGQRSLNSAGARPTGVGAIWKTPREIARDALALLRRTDPARSSVIGIRCEDGHLFLEWQEVCALANTAQERLAAATGETLHRNDYWTVESHPAACPKDDCFATLVEITNSTAVDVLTAP